MNKVTWEKNEWGEYKIIEKPNGIKIRMLKKPSEKYKEKIKKHSLEESKKRELKKEKRVKEKLIKDKMRELAIKELEQEGKL
jgi:hypothetical protein